MADDRLPRKQWRLAKLKDHPLQAATFGDLPEAEIAALAEDLKANGQKVPIDVLPDGTVVAGHQRVRAARMLGWKAVAAVVRTDLAEAGPAAVEAHFLGDNLHRRHLSPLARARCVRRLLELDAGRATRSFTDRQREQLKTAIGRRLGLSLRSVNRYLAVLDAPAEVQQALERGRLTLIAAGQAAHLGLLAKQELVRRLRAGEVPRKALAAVKRDAPAAGAGAAAAVTRLLKALGREVPQLAELPPGLAPRRLRRLLPTLRGARKVLKRLIALAESA
jgi:ParB family chromosome partitioning protein